MKTHLYLLMFCCTILLFSCNKDEQQTSTPSTTISISTPSENAYVTDSLFQIIASVTANGEIHGYHITVYDLADMGVLYETVYSDHATQFSINKSQELNVNDTIQAKMVLEVAVDHSGGIATKERHFFITP